MRDLLRSKKKLIQSNVKLATAACAAAAGAFIFIAVTDVKSPPKFLVIFFTSTVKIKLGHNLNTIKIVPLTTELKSRKRWLKTCSRHAHHS